MKININLSKSSIEKAIKQLEAYRDSLNDKNLEFVTKLGQLGIPVINQLTDSADGDSNKTHSTMITYSHKGNDAWQATLSVSGKDILFIEFGSGIYYNPSDPEHAKEFGYGVGTYPGQTHAFDPNGWWYRDEFNEPHHSYGTRATSPMLYASRTIIMEIRRIAREVYGSN